MRPSPTREATPSPEATGGGQPAGGRPRRPDLVVARGGSPESNVTRALAGLGGIGAFVKRGARVVVKPNLLVGRAPEYAVTTNPELVGALVRMALEAGAADVVVLDRPTSEPRSAFEVSGIADAARKAGGRIKILTDRNFERVAIPEGRQLTSWPLVTDVFEADTFINVPIAKTHSLAGLTLSMKNLMGIMGDDRGAIHIGFDQKIVDLNTLVRPHLIVLDATRILIRNGPTGGGLADVRRADTVVVGTNQAGVDAYGATLFGVQPADLGFLALAGDQGLGEIDLAKLSIERARS